MTCDLDFYAVRRRVTELERAVELMEIRLDALENDVMRYCLLMGVTLGCALGALVVVMLAVVL